jgi:hypothetical protein
MGGETRRFSRSGRRPLKLLECPSKVPRKLRVPTFLFSHLQRHFTANINSQVCQGDCSGQDQAWLVRGVPGLIRLGCDFPERASKSARSLPAELINSPVRKVMTELCEDHMGPDVALRKRAERDKQAQARLQWESKNFTWDVRANELGDRAVDPILYDRMATDSKLERVLFFERADQLGVLGERRGRFGIGWIKH